MIETHLINVRTFYEQYVTLAGKPSRAWRTGELEFHSNCPWCGGQDRFAFWSSGRYSCSIRASGCGRYGRDVIDFLREYEGLNFLGACDLLGIDPGSASQRLASAPAAAPDEPPPRPWQERATAVLQQAQRILWSSRGQTALAYLRSRGFIDDTIRTAQLGYLPLTGDGKWFQDDGRRWGTADEQGRGASIWLPEGVLIPWYADGQLWKLSVRRFQGLGESDARYVQITGSREGCYQVDAIRVDAPLVLCESEFDALSGQQACGELAAFVATGAITRARCDRWLARMGLASCVLVAYDDDPAGPNGKSAGDAGAAYWVQMLPHALRWLPWAHDVNDMLTSGQDLRAWTTLGLAVAASREQTVPLDPSRHAETVDEGCSVQESTVTVHSSDHAVSCPPELERKAMSGSAVSWTRGEGITEQTNPPAKASPEAWCPSIALHLRPSSSSHCQFELVTVGRDQRIRASRCLAKALANGWCEAHQHAQEVLDLGARLGYPHLDLTPHRAVGAGKGCWQAYAARATTRWLQHDLPRMKAVVAQGGTL